MMTNDSVFQTLPSPLSDVAECNSRSGCDMKNPSSTSSSSGAVLHKSAH